MARPQSFPVRLTQEQRESLEQLRDQPLPRKQRYRCDILLRADEGDTDGEIADDLFVSVNTVKAHLRSMYRKLGVDVLGIVENMSWFENPETGKPIAIFGSGGGEQLAKECDLPLIGQIPLDPRIQEGGDTGRPILDAEPGSKAAKAIQQAAQRVIERLDERYR